jgi:NAD(P)-dependent dehydrogenase (short-subunit alcohol dehydrogenase family)
VIYNAHKFLVKPFADTCVADFETVWRTDVLGAVATAKSLLPSMLENGGGTMILSGATASRRGSIGFSAFASAKFALRGLAQSLAREYGPLGIHVAHVIIDGIIRGGHAQQLYNIPDETCIDPSALAAAYLSLIAQPRSAWSQEIDIRPHNAAF